MIIKQQERVYKELRKMEYINAQLIPYLSEILPASFFCRLLTAALSV